MSDINRSQHNVFSSTKNSKTNSCGGIEKHARLYSEENESVLPFLVVENVLWLIWRVKNLNKLRVVQLLHLPVQIYKKNATDTNQPIL